MAEKKKSDIRQRLRAALDATSRDAIARIVNEERVALGELWAHLDEFGRKVLREWINLCRRWQVEGGPHPGMVTKVRVRGIEVPNLSPWREEREPSYRTRVVRKALPDWDAPSTQHLRGLLRGALNKDGGRDRAAVGKRENRKAIRDQSESLQVQAVAAVDTFENPDSGGDHNPDWTHKDVAGVLGVSVAALNGRQRDGSYRLPDYMRRYKEHRADPEGRRRSARERNP